MIVTQNLRDAISCLERLNPLFIEISCVGMIAKIAALSGHPIGCKMSEEMAMTIRLSMTMATKDHHRPAGGPVHFYRLPTGNEVFLDEPEVDDALFGGEITFVSSQMRCGNQWVTDDYFTLQDLFVES